MKMERAIGNVLRYGVLLAGAVIASGVLLVALAPRGPSPLMEALFRGERVTAAYAGPERLIVVGIALLILLPVVRVALTLVLFAKQRDWIYVALSATVLSLLLFGLCFGHSL